MAKNNEEYKYIPHNFEGFGLVGGKPVCIKCGLVALKNEFTSWCIEKGCEHKSHSQYPKKVKKYGFNL